jgi:hypothetical protein
MNIQMPDSALCKAATEFATSAYPAFLLNHCQRSFIFGDALGTGMGRAYNRELLYVACLLHDLGMTESAPVETRFEVEGADAAQAFLAKHGVAMPEQELVWDAIALHTTLVIPQRKRPEIALCQLGTAIDVGFAPKALLSEQVLLEALEAFPRLDFKHEMVACFCGLLRRNPAAASLSTPVCDVAERLVPGFSRPHFCDVITTAEFDG